MNNTLEIILDKLSLVISSNSNLSDIFGFGEFVSALALLIIVYTTTNNRYKFRLSIVPFPIQKISFIILLFIGIGTLLIEVWFSKKWLIPQYISDYIYLQSFFASLFLLIISLWLYYAFINPPIFSKYNYKKFIHEVYRLIINGEYNDLIMISNEIGRSSDNIIKYSSEVKTEYLKVKKGKVIVKPRKYLIPNDEISKTAYHLLLLFANKKFCKEIINTSPITVIRFINSIEKTQRYDVPIGQFLANISEELILNKNSILYSESEKYSYDLIGNEKYFTKTLYGNFRLLKSVDNLTPYHFDYQLSSSFNSEEYKAFTNTVLITIESYLKNNGVYWNHFIPLNQAFDIIKNSVDEIYKINKLKKFDEITSNISFKKLEINISFIIDFIKLLEKYPSKRYKCAKYGIKEGISTDIYDELVDIIFEMIFKVSQLKLSKKNIWWIHHNIVWSSIYVFHIENTEVVKLIKQKLRRCLYNKIMNFNKYSNFESALILGFMLNILGLKADKNGLYKSWYGFHKLILKWTKYNYFSLLLKREDIAKKCLLGYVKLNRKKTKLIYLRNKEYLKIKKIVC